jgi:hypothetical protein
LQIADYFSPENPTARYAYGFGDDWEHAITLEQILSRGANVRYPRILAGSRTCPPEGVGGVWGYEDFLQIIADP